MSDKQAQIPPSDRIPDEYYEKLLRLEKERELAAHHKKVRRLVRNLALIGTCLIVVSLVGVFTYWLDRQSKFIHNQQELEEWLGISIPEDATNIQYRSLRGFDDDIWLRFSLSPDKFTSFANILKLNTPGFIQNENPLNNCLNYAEECKTEAWWNPAEVTDFTGYRFELPVDERFVNSWYLVVDKGQPELWTIYMRVLRYSR